MEFATKWSLRRNVVIYGVHAAQKVHSLTRVARKVAGGARLGPGGRGLVDAGLAHARVEERVEAQVLLVPAVEGAAAKGRADQPDARVALVEEPQDHVRLGHALGLCLEASLLEFPHGLSVGRLLVIDGFGPQG